MEELIEIPKKLMIRDCHFTGALLAAFFFMVIITNGMHKAFKMAKSKNASI